MLKLYNTAPRLVEEFTPQHPPKVTMYSCGPTVYDYQHIGHMRRYVGDDILIRVLRANGYIVDHAMNITDVGHLVSDSDTGEDKMEKGARKFGKSVWDVAKMFEEQFLASANVLHINIPAALMHATDYIADQIKLVQVLEEKGYTYRLADGIYFDTSKFANYFKLSRQKPEELKKGARVDFVVGKRHVSDFALWKFSYPNGRSFDPAQDDAFLRRQMEWESPWGVGFPGWHIECSAMSMKALGETLDIHTGGIDHIAIHHTNEIAQSEAATGKQFVRCFVHNNFLIVNGEKMSKSLGNFYTVQDVVARGYDPLSLRYLYLQTHYRQEMNFTWESLDAAAVSLKKLRSHVISNEVEKSQEVSRQARDDKGLVPHVGFMNDFMTALNDDLNTAKALGVVWEVVKADMLFGEKRATILAMDTILGLDLDKKEETVEIPQNVQQLVQEREAFRKSGDWEASDELRKKIADLGFVVEDSKEGPKIIKK